MELRALAAPTLPRSAVGFRCAPARAACSAAAPPRRRVAALLASRVALLPSPLARRGAPWPRARPAWPRAPPAAHASADGAFATALAAWEATQRVVLWATAAGLAICAAVATTARGRATLLAAWTDFQSSPEGAQAASLVQYLLLILVARVLEYLTGARGILTFVYLGIFAMQLLHWLRTGLPGPEEARARVEALEAGLPYAGPPPGPEAQAAFRAALPALQAEALALAAPAALRGGGEGVPPSRGTLFLTRATLAFAADGDAPQTLALPLAACADVAAGPDAVAVLVVPALGAAPLRIDPLPPAGPDRPRVSLAKVLVGYWKRAVAPAS